MECNEVCAKCIVSIFGVDNLWQIEWINANVGVKTEANIGAANGVGEFLILVFWVDNENFGANHHGAESFELNGKRFTCTRLSEDDHVGVF